MLTTPPRTAMRAALLVRRALHRLADSFVPPQLVLFDLATGLGRTHALKAVVGLRLPDRLDGAPQTTAELAEACGVEADALDRLLRACTVLGLFERGPDGRWRNSRLSDALRSDAPGSFGPFATYFGSHSNARAWMDLENTLKDGRSAFDRVHGMSVWEWFDAHPDERDTFADAMANLTAMDAPAVASSRAFRGLQRVCDVGGGRGLLLGELLARHPASRGVLLDSPGVIQRARGHLADRGVLERVELVPGNFFEAVPSDCDGYVLKNVLHDWDDERCLGILGNVRRSIAPGGKILVVEMLLGDGLAEPAPLSDLQMMVVAGDGRERTAEHYGELLNEAGFAVRGVHPTSSPMCVVEAVAA